MSCFLPQEEEERRQQEEKEKKELEEYLLLKKSFVVEEEGQVDDEDERKVKFSVHWYCFPCFHCGLPLQSLQEFVEYIQVTGASGVVATLCGYFVQHIHCLYQICLYMARY